MKKIISGIMLTVLLTSLLTLTFNIQPVEAEPGIIFVPDDYPTIQAAVNAANPADTIIVRAGTYSENLKVNKNYLTIESESGAQITIVQAAKPDVPVFLVSADYVSINGFMIKGAGITTGIGIGLYPSNYCNISNNHILNNGDGIHSWNSSHITLISNKIEFNSDRGIEAWYLKDSTITNNVVRSNGFIGIHLIYSHNNRVINNSVISNNIEGIYLPYSSNNFIYFNNFIDNNAALYESNNIWNSPEPVTYTYNGRTYTNYLGNYWSDYAGSDADGDGIGDTPYIIDGDKDNYPLMEPFENYVAPTPPEWTFAIITDLHIGRGYPDYGGRGVGIIEDREVVGQDYYLTERLNDIVRWINDDKNEYNIEFVVVLGDISDSGEYSELKKAKNILDELDVPYIPVIGNHDVWPYTRDGEFEQIRYFEYVFKDQFEKLRTDASFNLHKQPNLNPQDLQNYVFRYEEIEFIILDCVAREPFPGPTKGVGSDAVLWDSTLLWLTENLQSGKPTIILSHHPFMADPKKLFVTDATSGFSPLEMTTIDEAIKISKAKVLANFAGHVHGYYDEYHPAGFLPGINPVFLNANKDYKEEMLVITPADISVVTTEAIMVASNEPDPKGIIRIVKVKGEEITIPLEVEGEFRALDPYLRVTHAILNPADFTGSYRRDLIHERAMCIAFEAYAFTKRFTVELPLSYNIDFGDGSAETILCASGKPVIFKHYYRDLKPDRTYNLTLTVGGFTPDGKEVIEEEITQTITLSWPSKDKEPRPTVLRVGNRRDMSYLVKLYKQDADEPWQEIVSLEFTYLAPWSKKPFSILQELNEDS